MRRPAAFAAALVTALAAPAATACSAEARPEVVVTNPAVGATDGNIAAMYLDLENDGGGDALLAARCTCAAEVSLHVTDDEGGRSMMVTRERLDLPSGAEVPMWPAGAHVMLEHLTAPLVEGDSIEVTLEFDRSEPLVVDVPVVAVASLVDRVPR